MITAKEPLKNLRRLKTFKFKVFWLLINQLKTFKFEAKQEGADFELGAIGLLLWAASSALLRSLCSSGFGDPERFTTTFLTTGWGRKGDEQKWLMVYLWLALMLLVLWLLLF